MCLAGALVHWRRGHVFSLDGSPTVQINDDVTSRLSSREMFHQVVVGFIVMIFVLVEFFWLVNDLCAGHSNAAQKEGPDTI